ncbi:hypothetical protein BJY01DRAFT_232331 [Aspergillus pseudoustus]|uniref:Helicase C-terminal domain-containing protein n=1 Tax=Aspergillus pseudoustus TaxID=1810923 RepID=A0ABR4KLT8_9EURO
MAAPGKPVVKQARRSFFTAVRPLRKLGIAVFALKMARLNAVMETVGGDTHFKTIRSWRNNGLDSDFIHALTRGEGEPPPHNAESLISHLTRGSPVVRLVFQEILTVKAVERVNKAAFGHHQKLIVGEIVPANAFYLEQVLRACLIDARVFHANLSNHAKTAMVELFNDPNSTLKVLIMLYEVGAVGLNLHKACNRVVIASIPRSRAQESQLAGRALRITSEFPLTVVRRVTPDSHDAFRGSKQAEKAALQLAANARDPSIKELLVKLLNEFQKEVNLYHSQAKPRVLEVTPPTDPPVSPFANQDTPSPKKKPESTIIPPEERKLRDRTQITRSGKSPYMEDSTEEDEEDNALFVKQDDSGYLDAGEDHDEEDVIFDDEFSISDISSEDESDAEDDNQLRNLDTSQFMNQPDDFTRHKNTLLKHPAGKIWSMKDLDDEKFLKLALRLLYNKMNGIELLHLDKSIHICYKQFSKKLRFRAEKSKTPTMENQEMAKEKGL